MGNRTALFRRREHNGPGHAPRFGRRLLTRPNAREGSRRFLNVLVAVLGVIVVTPFALVIAMLVRATSHGPAIYSQTRIGLDRRRSGADEASGRRQQNLGGKPFRIYKFRTMRPQDGPTEQEGWASPDDPRVTHVGRLLRLYRLDELPQLLNVIRGDMNIVGPRPEQPRIFAKLRDEIEEYEIRQRVRPGITGWAQINHHYDLSTDDVKKKLHLDLEYLSRQSSIEDLRIMARTFPVMLFRKGAW